MEGDGQRKTYIALIFHEDKQYQPPIPPQPLYRQAHKSYEPQLIFLHGKRGKSEGDRGDRERGKENEMLFFLPVCFPINPPITLTLFCSSCFVITLTL